MRKFAMLVLVMVGIVLSGGLLGGVALAADDETEFIFLVHQDWKGFDPRIQLEVNGRWMAQFLYNGLVRANPDTWEIEPDLALSWENPDPTTYIFHLRQDVTFHDGVKMTAADVKYTFDSVNDPATLAVGFSANLEAIESVTIIDDYTVEMKLKRPFAPILNYLRLPIVPKHICEANPDQLSTDPIGTGPMKFVELVSLSHLILEANDDYFGGQPAIDRFVFKTVLEDSSRLLQVQAGDADAALSPPIKRIAELTANPDLGIVSAPSPSIIYGWVDCATKPFNDKRVRQAMMYAIDTEEVSLICTDGLYRRQNSFILDSSWAYNPDVNPYDQDLEKGRQLLAEAGVPEGFQFVYTTDYHWRSQPELEVTAQQFQEIGLEPLLDIRHWNAVWPGMKAGLLTAVMGMGHGNILDPDEQLYRQFHSSMQPPFGWNYGHYVNPEVDRLLDEARATVDRDARKALYFEVQLIINEDCAQFPLYSSVTNVVFDATEWEHVPYNDITYFYELIMEAH
ncbi:ABC transporter substrate-binding protein [Candidatus Bipolaricaulota bacterium]